MIKGTQEVVSSREHEPQSKHEEARIIQDALWSRIQSQLDSLKICSLASYSKAPFTSTLIGSGIAGKMSSPATRTLISFPTHARAASSHASPSISGNGGLASPQSKLPGNCVTTKMLSVPVCIGRSNPNRSPIPPASIVKAAFLHIDKATARSRS